MKQPASDNPVIEEVTTTSGSGKNTEAPPVLTEEYPATDKELIIYFFACGHPFIRKLKKPGYKTMFWFNRAVISEALKRWQSPEPIMMDIRVLFAAERTFYSAIHDD